MPKPGAETRQQIAKIEAERERLKELLRRQENLLKIVEEKGIPDSQPFISFKPAKEIKDLAGQPGNLRATLKDEIAKIKQALNQLMRDAALIKRVGYKEYIRQERAKVVRIDRQFEAEMTRVLRSAESRGYLSDEELTGLRQGASGILEAYTGLLQLDHSQTAMRDVLDQIADVYALDDWDPKVVGQAFQALTDAGRKNVEDARRAVDRNPSNKNARQLVRAATHLYMLGDLAGGAAAVQHTVAWAESRKDTAERVFRAVPSTENLRTMLQAEITCVEMGGTAIVSPPRGLKRVKDGKEHPLKKGETLSGISKTYYGSFSYWDVLVRGNPQLWATPDRPPTGVISIPY